MSVPLESAQLTVDRAGPAVVIRFGGRLDAAGAASLWERATEAVAQTSGAPVIADVSSVEYCDVSGAALLIAAWRRARFAGVDFALEGVRPELGALRSLFNPADFEFSPIGPDRRTSLPEEVGRVSVELARDVGRLVSFVGELSLALAWTLVRPRTMRWSEFLAACERAGVNATPIISLVGFLVGVILAFQTAGPMARFGAELLTIDVVSIAMVRELGPLMTAIILAGRSGSAFAAEIGTMKVREEIDALTTMGLDPTPFLVTPRVLAAVVMMPLMSMAAIVAGLVGGALVMMSLDYPLAIFVAEAQEAVNYVDLLGALAKSLVFGLLVAGIGCYRGLRTASGPSAVGDSTTSAVVSGIVLLAIADGVFSFVYYSLGI